MTKSKKKRKKRDLLDFIARLKNDPALRDEDEDTDETEFDDEEDDETESPIRSEKNESKNGSKNGKHKRQSKHDRTRHLKKKWNDGIYVRAYIHAKDGSSTNEIANSLGVKLQTFQRWVTENPFLAEAVKLGRQGSEDKPNTFQEYVYNRLPKHLRNLWEQIMEVHKKPNSVAKIEHILKGHGKIARQHLFIHALTASNFNVSRAMRQLNINRKVFEHWCRNDLNFAELMEEIHFHKQNYFENALVGLVSAGDSPATIFANKTFNRDRGYGERIEHHHTGEVHHLHEVVGVDELELPMDVRKAILDAMEKRDEKLNVTSQEVITYEPKSKEDDE